MEKTTCKYCGKELTPPGVHTCNRTETDAEFVKRMRGNLQIYIPMLQSLNAGKGIKEDFINACTRLEQHRWIPVSERLPEEEKHPDSLGHSKSVLCYNPDLKACHKANIGSRYWVDIYYLPSDCWMMGLRPTHWMPIIPEQAEDILKEKRS